MRRVVCLFSVAFACAAAQQAPAVTQAANGTQVVSRTAAAASNPLEVEMVEIGRLMAIPNKIQRHPGKFILLVKNENTADWDAAFVLDPSSVGDGIVGPNPLVRFGGKGLTDAKNRSVTIVDAVAGSWDLKSATTGKIACRITIQ